MSATHTQDTQDEVLTTLAAKAHAHEDAWTTGENLALSNAVKMGEYLTEAKACVPHGEWLPWLKANGFGERKARRAMTLAANRSRLSDLDETTITGALAFLAQEKLQAKAAKLVERGKPLVDQMNEVLVLTDGTPHPRVDQGLLRSIVDWCREAKVILREAIA